MSIIGERFYSLLPLKTIIMIQKFFTSIVVVLLSALTFTSCSSDDEGGSGDFIEVTIDGKTYRHNVYGIYAEVTLGDDMLMTYSTEDVFYDDGFQFFYGIFHHENQSKLLKCSTGDYGISEYSIYEDNARNLDFSASLELNEGDAWWEAESGKHTVTSIKAVENGVQIEGVFNISMYGDENGYRDVKGKYRMTVGGYTTSL